MASQEFTSIPFAAIGRPLRAAGRWKTPRASNRFVHGCTFRPADGPLCTSHRAAHGGSSDRRGSGRSSCDSRLKRAALDVGRDAPLPECVLARDRFGSSAVTGQKHMEDAADKTAHANFSPQLGPDLVDSCDFKKDILAGLLSPARHRLGQPVGGRSLACRQPRVAVPSAQSFRSRSLVRSGWILRAAGREDGIRFHVNPSTILRGVGAGSDPSLASLGGRRGSEKEPERGRSRV